MADHLDIFNFMELKGTTEILAYDADKNRWVACILREYSRYFLQENEPILMALSGIKVLHNLGDYVAKVRGTKVGKTTKKRKSCDCEEDGRCGKNSSSSFRRSKYNRLE